MGDVKNPPAQNMKSKKAFSNPLGGLAIEARKRMNAEIRIRNYQKFLDLINHGEGTIKTELKVGDEFRYIRGEVPKEEVVRFLNELIAQNQKLLV